MPPKGSKRTPGAGSKAEAEESTKGPEQEGAAAKPAKEKEEKKTSGRGWGWGKKRKQPDAANGEETGEPKAKIKVKSSITDSFAGIDFSAKAKTADGREANIKIASWNVNGLKNWLEKDGTAYIKAENPDVMCIQKLKCEASNVPDEAEVEGYTAHWLSGDAEGFSGVGLYYKTKPIKITDGIGNEKHDAEGRVITAEFDKFFLVNTYVPNSGRDLTNLDYRTKEWDVSFRKYIKSLDEQKPVVWAGDLNVAHHEIDIRNPKGNKRTAGFTLEERESFTATLREGLIDSFRHVHPHEENAFTYWTHMMNARAKNAGWRLDYFIVSERLKENLCDSIIRNKVMGSDHCPIVLQLAL